MRNQTQINELQSALQEMLPVGVGFGVDQATVEAEPFQYREEGQHLAKAVLSRRNEFIFGRRCARAALSHIGQVPCAVPSDTNGLPMWPAGTVGSISHSRGLCCAVAVPADEMLNLGVDLEKTSRLSARAMERVVHPLEATAVGDDQTLGSLLFSAKEAFYKAQFPVCQAQPGFKDLALKIHTDTQQLSILELAPHLSKALHDAALRMEFRYQFVGDYVVTLCWIVHD